MTAPSHTGTRGRYVEGCRCSPCTQANNRYHRSRRAHRVNLPAEPLLAMYQGVPEEEIAHRLGVGRHTLNRWRQNGLTLTSGDRIAISLGTHPYVIWGNHYWEATL
jgi:hypothetical protein